MGFEDQLRSAMNQIDYRDRDKLMRQTAKATVEDFKDTCMLYARMGKSSCSLIASAKEPGKTHIVYVYRDEEYDAARAKGTPLAHLGESIFLKLSEAEPFLAYIREEYRRHDMAGARVDLMEDFTTMPKQGLFGTVRQVRYSNNRYKVMLSMSW